MSRQSFWDRIRQARIVQVVLVYLGAAWAVLEVTQLLQETLELPAWVVPVALILLLIGGVIILVTAWVQALPVTRERAASGELPGAWDVAPGGLMEAIREGELPHLTWARAILGGVFALWLLFGFAGLYVLLQDRGQTFAPAVATAGEAATGIAVVPFTTRGEGLDLWREGMVDLFAMSLDGVGGYRTIDSRTVMARWRDAVGGAGEPDLATVREIARRAGARYVMTGNVVSVGDDLHLQAELVDVETGRDVGAGGAEGPEGSVPALVDRISIEVMGDLLREQGSEVLTAHRAASRTTESLPALKAYLEGEAHFRDAEFHAAGEAYDRALAADSGLALAHLRLSQVYGWVESINSERARDHMTAAERLVDELSPRDRALVEGYAALRDRDLSSIGAVEATAAKYPDDPEAQFLLGEFYVHHGTPLLAPLSETSDVLRRVVELDPSFGPYYAHAIEYAIAEGDGEWAQQLLEGYERVAGEEADNYRDRSFAVDLMLGDSTTQAAARAAIDTLHDDSLRGMLWALFFITERPAALLPVVEEAQTRRLLPPWVLQWSLFQAGKFEERTARSGRLQPDWPAALSAHDTYRLAGLELPPGVEPISSRECEQVGHPDGQLWCRMQLIDWHLLDGEVSAADEVLGEIREAGARFEAEGDTLQSVNRARAVAAIEAYALSVTTGPEAAIAGLEPLARRRSDAADQWLRFWLADLNRTSGRLREAIPYYESLRRDGMAAYASYYLGQIYEELDLEREAIDAYTTLLQVWEEADADIPRLIEVRAALDRLMSASD